MTAGRPPKRIEAAILVSLLAALALFHRSVPADPGMLRWDEAEYAALGRALWRGEPYAQCGRPEALRPPGLPILLAASFAAAGSASDVVARAAAGWLAVAAVAGVWFVARRLWDLGTACWTALLLGLAPAFSRSTTEVMTELPFLAVFAGALALFDRGLRSPRLLPWAAALAGAALLLRYTAVLALPIGIVLLAHAAWKDRKPLLATLRGPWPWLALGVLLLVVGPWLVRQGVRFGDPLVGFRAASGQLVRYAPEWRMPIWFYPAALPGMLTWPVALLAVWGAVESWRRGDAKGRAATLVIAVLVLWFSAYRFKEPRQITAALPWLAMLAALGAGAALRLFGSRWGRRVAAFVGVFAIGTVAYREASADVRGRVTLGYPSLVQAMAALRERAAPGDRVLTASTPQVCWYSALSTSGLPDAVDADSGLAAARERGEWLVLTNYERGQAEWATALFGSAVRGKLPGAWMPSDRRFATVLVPLTSEDSAAPVAPAAVPQMP